MSFKPIGYEFTPKTRHQAHLHDYVTTGGWAGGTPVMPPSPAIPIFADRNGDHFTTMPMDDRVVAMPFIAGSPAEVVDGGVGELGGFVPAEKMPKSGAGGDPMIKGIVEGLPAATATDWLGNAATKAMLGGASGGVVDSVLATLGVPSPVASGVMGAALNSALGAAGLGPVGGMLGNVLSGGGGAGIAKSLGSMGVNNLLASSGLSNVPGMGALGSIAGGQMGGALADIMNTGGWAGPLDNATSALTGCLPGGGCDPKDIEDLIGGGCFPGNGGPDLGSVASGIGADALNDAADQMLSQWEVDDESSAAEHIAHKAVNDNKEKIKEAVSDPSAFSEKVAKFFRGEGPGAGFPAARITDSDVTKPEIISKGVANILVGGLPVSRITDTISPSMALILEGASTVLSAELPTARMTSATDSPGIMIEKGEPTVLVGGASAAIDPPSQANAPSSQQNECPAGPDAPEKPSSDSAGGGDQSGGETDATDAGDSTPGTESEVDAPESEGASPDSEGNAPTEEGNASTEESNAPTDEGGKTTEESNGATEGGDASESDGNSPEAGDASGEGVTDGQQNADDAAASAGEDQGIVCGDGPGKELSGKQVIGVFSDGSESKSFRESMGDKYYTSTGQPLSHVRNDCEDHPAASSDKLYLDGPRQLDGLEDETIGSMLKRGWDPQSMPPYKSDMKANEDRIVDFVCDKYAENPDIVVDMTGHSRGGASEIGAVNRLGTEGCYNPQTGKNEPVNIRSLNLYDPVNMTRIENGDYIGNNVENVNVVYADPLAPGKPVSRSAFIREETKTMPGSSTDRNEKRFPVTHSGAGGAPGHGDFPPGYDPKREVEQTKAVGDYMRDKMREDGINIQREKDYGYGPAPAPISDEEVIRQIKEKNIPTTGLPIDVQHRLL